MPDELERKLKAEARRKYPDDVDAQNAYVYGTLRKRGWKPRREKRRIRKLAT